MNKFIYIPQRNTSNYILVNVFQIEQILMSPEQKEGRIIMMNKSNIFFYEEQIDFVLQQLETVITIHKD